MCSSSKLALGLGTVLVASNLQLQSCGVFDESFGKGLSYPQTKGRRDFYQETRPFCTSWKTTIFPSTLVIPSQQISSRKMSVYKSQHFVHLNIQFWLSALSIWSMCKSARVKICRHTIDILLFVFQSVTLQWQWIKFTNWKINPAIPPKISLLRHQYERNSNINTNNKWEHWELSTTLK